jgi:CheY-like chemotaxis protein
MAHADTKTVEILALKSALTPCILDEDPAQLEALAALVEQLGYESILTSDPEEALKCVRYGRSRLLLADPGVHGYEFLDKALRTDPFAAFASTASFRENARPENCSAEGQFSQVDAEGLCSLLPNDTKREPCCIRLLARSMQSRTAFDRQVRNCTPTHVSCGPEHRVGSFTSLERIPAQRGDVVSGRCGVSRKGSRQP